MTKIIYLKPILEKIQKENEYDDVLKMLKYGPEEPKKQPSVDTSKHFGSPEKYAPKPTQVSSSEKETSTDITLSHLKKQQWFSSIDNMHTKKNPLNYADAKNAVDVYEREYFTEFNLQGHHFYAAMVKADSQNDSFLRSRDKKAEFITNDKGVNVYLGLSRRNAHWP